LFGKHHSDETKEKISESRKGAKAWNKGVSADPEKIKSMNDKWRGCKQSEETLKIIGEATRKMWAKKKAEGFTAPLVSQETREKLRVASLATWAKRKQEREQCQSI
jgi:hypothetical protein